MMSSIVMMISVRVICDVTSIVRIGNSLSDWMHSNGVYPPRHQTWSRLILNDDHDK